MNRFIKITLVLGLCFGLAACGDDETTSSDQMNLDDEVVQDELTDNDAESDVSEDESDTAVEMTLGQKNALESAESYLKYSGFSYSGLIDQLEFEGYTSEEAIFAVDNCGADWNQEAVESAESYIEYSGFSYSGLIGQLEFEGFTSEEAKYGADNCGADWMQEAVETAESYLEYSSFSKQGLIDQLEFEGFTSEEISHAIESVGY